MMCRGTCGNWAAWPPKDQDTADAFPPRRGTIGEPTHRHFDHLEARMIMRTYYRAQWAVKRPQSDAAVTNARLFYAPRDCRSAPSPSRPHPFRFANRALVTSDNLAWAARAAAFRLRLGSGAVALRLRFAMRASPPSAPLLRTPTTDRRLDTATRELVPAQSCAPTNTLAKCSMKRIRFSEATTKFDARSFGNSAQFPF